MTGHSPVFRKAMRQIAQGDVLAPAVRLYLADPNFRGFDIQVRGIGKRPYDGKFHPSEHPGMTLRALFLYLTQPDVLIKKQFDPMAILSMTAGSIWHSIVGRILCQELGIVKDLEVFVKDPITLAQGNMDGVLADEVYELKTMKDAAIQKVTSVEEYIRLHPDYYLQAQEYMRLSGYRKERVLVMALTYPYEMREFVIDYAPAVALAIRDKYLAAIQAAADQKLPPCDGCKGNTCPARAFCDHHLRTNL